MKRPRTWEPRPRGDPSQRYSKPSSHLLRKGRFGGANTAVMITKCRHPRRRLDLSAQSVAPHVVRALLAARETGRCYLLAWCLMSDHIHILLAPRDTRAEATDGSAPVGAPSSGRPSSARLSPLSRFVAGWASSAAHLVNRAVRSRGALWQEGFYDHSVRRDERLGDIVDYIHQNPVRRGLTEHPEAWRWSSATPLFASLTDWDWFVGNSPRAGRDRTQPRGNALSGVAAGHDRPEDRAPTVWARRGQRI
jgi:REP element-mobilizing transposase RayT